MPWSASAPSRTAWECLAKRSKNRSSLGRKARNQRSSISMSKLQNRRAKAACHISVIDHLDKTQRRKARGIGPHPRLYGRDGRREPYLGLQRTAEEMGYYAHNAPAERQHAGHENRTLDHGHPGTKSGKILLCGDDDERADHRAVH